MTSADDKAARFAESGAYESGCLNHVNDPSDTCYVCVSIERDKLREEVTRLSGKTGYCIVESLRWSLQHRHIKCERLTRERNALRALLTRVLVVIDPKLDVLCDDIRAVVREDAGGE